MNNQDKLTRAAIVKVEHAGGYLVCRVASMPGESVTVSIQDWIDTQLPVAGTDVLLLGPLIRHRRGWRANRARYLQPDDVV